MSQHSEVVVVGGGVIGSSIAYHLARAGASVLVVERAAEVATEPSASWASAGGVRRQGRHVAEAALARESIERWPGLAAELESDLGYRQGGNLLLAEDDAQAARLRGFVDRQHARGFADVMLLDRAAIRALAPPLADRFVAASFSPADGQADPRATTLAFAAASRRLGATYWTGTAASSLLLDAAVVRGVYTSRGPVEAGTVVLAAGAWTDTLAEAIGARLPMRTAVYQMLHSTPGRNVTLGPVVSCFGRRLSLKQLDDGSFLLGGGWPGDVTGDRTGYAMRPDSVDGNWKTACDILPALSARRVNRAWCGLEALSIDELPFVGRVGGIGGLVVATGFSGHGFALAPAVGRALADLIAGKTVPELDQLSPERIARLDPDAIASFVAG